MVDVICSSCGKTFSAKQSRINQGHGKFCSHRCANLSRSFKRHTIVKSCLFCGTEFEFSISAKRKFCSRDCCNKYKIGKKQSYETISKKSASLMGHDVSDETKLKISRALSGEKNPNFGKHRPDDVIEKIRLGNVNKVFSEDTRAKMSANHADISGDKNPMKRPEVRGKFTGDNNPMRRPEVKIKLAGENSTRYGKPASHSRGQWFELPDGNKIYLRSSYEIRVAMMLLKLNIQFEYEPKAFQLDNGTTYRPDFYLPKYDYWWEVKGWMRDTARDKLSRFFTLYPDIQLRLVYKSDIVLLENMQTDSDIKDIGTSGILS